MKAVDKLRIYWSKRENGFMLNYPLGFSTSSDAHYLNGFIFTDYHKGESFQDFLKELDSRGYDSSTFKFSIEPKKDHIKFASERPEHYFESILYAESMGMV